MSDKEKIAELEKQVEELKSYIFLLKPASISPANAMLKIRQECRDKYLATWQTVRYGKEEFGPDKKSYSDYEAWMDIIRKETDLLFKYSRGKASRDSSITNLVSTQDDLEQYRDVCDRVCRDLREKIDQYTGRGETQC